MATSTTYLNLIKPESTDETVIRTIYNTNLDSIDDKFSDEYMAIQAKNSVTITGGSISGIPIPVIYKVKEENQSPIVKGQPVYQSGATGQAYPKVGLSDADVGTKAHVIGLANNNISQNDTGLIITSGLLENVDSLGGTDINPSGQNWSAGDKLYLHTTAGGLTNTEPTIGRVVEIGRSLYGSSNTDAIQVHIEVTHPHIEVATGEDIILRVGDSAGSNKVIIKDYTNTAVASIDSNGEILSSNVKKNKMDGTQAPTVNNDTDEGYEVGSNWYDETNDKAYICLDNTDGAAVWTETTAEGAGETNTASNIGSEAEIFKQKTDEDLEFRTLKEGTAINFTYEYGVTLKTNNTTHNDDGIVYDIHYRGQWWLAGSTYILGEIQALLYRVGDGETVTLYVFNADGDNKPTGEELGHIEVDCATITTSTAGEYVTFDLSSFDITITNGNKYCFYLVGDSNNSDHSIGYNFNSSSIIDNSSRITSDDSGGSWTVQGTSDVAFKIYTAASYYDYIGIGVVPSEIKLDDLGATDNNTDLDASTSAHGLLPILPFSGDLLSTTTVAFNADADTPLYTVPTGKRCVLSHAIVVAADDAGASTTVSIGANGAETDFIPANTLSNLDAQYDSVILQPIPNTTPLKIKSYAATTVIEAQVASQSGAAGNTIYLFGITY